MKKLFTVALLCLLVGEIKAQQDAQLTHYMFTRMVVNPAYAGSGDGLCGVLLGRQMWQGFDGAPRTFLLSAEMPVYRYRSGVGLNIIQDAAGFEKTFMANLNYAYKIPLALVPGGQLSVGISIGLLNKALNGAWRPVDTNFMLDDAIPNQRVSDMAFDLGMGVYYQAPQLYFGISSTRLPASTMDEISDQATTDGFDLVRHYYVMAGYKYNINQLFDVLPSVLVKTETASFQFDLNANLMYDNRFWAGLSYRLQDAAAVLAGFQQPLSGNNGTLKAGISYDITLPSSVRHGGSRGSTEVMVGFCYPIGGMPKPTRHRNVRTL